MNRTRLQAVCLAFVVLAVSLAAAKERLYKGVLDRELQGQQQKNIQLTPANEGTIAKLATSPKSGEQVYAGMLKPSKAVSYAIAVVVPASGKKICYFDLNNDGKFAADEGIVLSDKNEGEIKLPNSMQAFRDVTSTLIYREFTPQPAKEATEAQPAVKNGKKSETRALDVAPAGTSAVAATPAVRHILLVRTPSIATATIDIDGQKTLFRYNVDFAKQAIDPTSGQLEVDCNGNGTIDGYPNNTETANAKGAPVVFRVGGKYISTKSVDVNTREVLIQEHPASDYKRVELAVNSQVPDFEFKDFDGKAHKLSDYRGKYVLLDFWGTW